jgi:hypothetical protein
MAVSTSVRSLAVPFETLPGENSSHISTTFGTPPIRIRDFLNETTFAAIVALLLMVLNLDTVVVATQDLTTVVDPILLTLMVASVITINGQRLPMG